MANKKKNMQIPYADKTNMLEEMINNPGDYLDVELARDMLDYVSGNIEPDKSGADEYFLRYFINENMRMDFIPIATNFLRQHYPDLPSFEEPWFMLDQSRFETPSDAIKKRLLNLIFNAARAGDAYAKALMVYLYKTYYKREYKYIRKFKKLHMQELGAMMDVENDIPTVSVARIITMCDLMDIEIDPECRPIYILTEGVNRAARSISEEETDFLELDGELFNRCREQVGLWQKENEQEDDKYDLKLYEHLYDTEKFAGMCFRYNGYPEDYAYRCNDWIENIDERLVRTLVLLKTVFPKREFSFEEVQRYCALRDLVEVITEVSDQADDDMTDILAIQKERYSAELVNEGFDIDDKLDISISLPVRNQKSEPGNKKNEGSIENINAEDMLSADHEANEYIEEINRLRQKLHKQEEKYNRLQTMYQEIKQTSAEQKSLINRYEKDQAELEALREFADRTKEISKASDMIPLADMKEIIGSKKLMIAGGHTNWLKKMKDIFPNWEYVSMDFRTIDIKNFDNIEHVFFYTDYVSHSFYERMIKSVRDKGIPYSFIHGQNVDALTRHVYYVMNGNQ